MNGVNKVFIMGNLTRDPELKHTGKGDAVCGFSVAVNRKYRLKSGEMTEDTEFVDLVAWKKRAETIAQHMKKGSGILVIGRLKRRSWEEKSETTGAAAKRYKTEVIVDEFYFCGGKRDGAAPEINEDPSPGSEEDIPF